MADIPVIFRFSTADPSTVEGVDSYIQSLEQALQRLGLRVQFECVRDGFLLFCENDRHLARFLEFGREAAKLVPLPTNLFQPPRNPEETGDRPGPSAVVEWSVRVVSPAPRGAHEGPLARMARFIAAVHPRPDHVHAGESQVAFSVPRALEIIPLLLPLLARPGSFEP